ncbi:centrosomal protein of 164 kDa isoform X2 [Alligator mississippiensis]|uniref:centrosomal protein of 164 kDa isoform X2 n=1 Tax=Alligator mississippiensis TaxID=8496 RepID=UPI0028778E7A|nr:centrosomal protein of 164 kDa isoform X2 [Alligator mississippiensis]
MCVTRRRSHVDTPRSTRCRTAVPLRVAMAQSDVCIGDQLILEEEYDETYLPSEKEICDYARGIGIDPEKEPELMWLAKEGIVAPLPPQWKPCQDITGEIYYFNFANGQSTWDHPCDEHYRELVVQEREKLSAHGDTKKKDKKKKKEKKEKKDKKERELLKPAAEMQPEPGILPSTSFYQISSPILPSWCLSPDLEQNSQIKNEGFLKKGERMTLSQSSEASDSDALFSGTQPNNLQPFLSSKPSRTCQMLADLEILGRGPSFSKSDAGTQQGPDKSAEHCLYFSDSEPEYLDVVRTTEVDSYVSKESSSPDLENGKTILGSQEVFEAQSLLFVEEQMSENQKKKEMTEECVCQPANDLPVRERARGPAGDEERGPGLLQATVREAVLAACASNPVFHGKTCEAIPLHASPMEDLHLLEEVAQSLPEELSSHSDMVESRREKNLLEPVLSPTTTLGKCFVTSSRQGREGPEWARVAEPDTCLRASKDDGLLAIPCVTLETMLRASEAGGGSGVDASALMGTCFLESVFPCAAPEEEKAASGVGSECGSSHSSNVADNVAPLIWREGSNFSWDLQSSCESDDHLDLLASAKGPLLIPPLVMPQECAHDSLRMELGGLSGAQERDEEEGQEEAEEREGRPEQAPDVLKGEALAGGLRVPPAWLCQTAECQESSRLYWQVEVEMTQSRTAEIWDGAGNDESPGSLLAPAQAPLGNLAPLRGLVDVPAGALRGPLSAAVGNFVEPSPGIRGGIGPAQTLKATGQAKSLLGFIHQKKDFLNLMTLDEGENEDEESENQSLRGTAGLLQNVHMDISALGSSFDYEESLQARHAEGEESSAGACPPTPDKLLYRDADSSLSGLNKEECDGKPPGTELMEKEDAKVEGEISAAQEQPGTLGEKTTAGTDAPSSRGPSSAASPDAGAAEADQPASLAVTVDTVSIDGKVASETREEAADLQTDSKLEAGEDSEASERGKDAPLANHVDRQLLQVMDFGFQSRLSEQVLDVDALSPVQDGSELEARELGKEEKDQSQASIEEEQSKRAQSAVRCGSSDVDVPANISSCDSDAVQLEEGTQQAESSHQPAEKPLEGPAKELEEEDTHLLQAKREEVQRLREELRQKEEEEAQELRRQKEKSLRSLKEELAKATEEEELWLREEESKKLSKLRTQISAETEAEKEKIRAEQEAALQKLREEYESLQKSERERAEETKKCALEKIKLEVEEAQQRERMGLEQEKERVLNEIKERLERERKEAAEVLEKQFAAELQQLKAAAEEEHRKVVASLQKQVEETQRSDETQLREALERAEQKVQQKAYHLTEYERELSELMKEKRQEVERDHERKLERMKAEHREVLAKIQEQYEEEERKQRAERLGALTSEMERLRQLHDGELRALRKELDEQLSDLRRSHQEQERKLQDLEMELDLRAREAKARSAQLHSQEDTIRKKRQQLLDEEKLLEQERTEVVLAAQLRLEESRKEHTDLMEAIRKLRRTLQELQDQKAELESQVDLLQSRSQRLQKRISELEAAIRSKQDLLKELEAEDSTASPRREAELHIEDLKETIRAHSSRQTAPLPLQSHEDGDLWLDDVRHYISAQGISIRNAKEFLERQTRSMSKRRTALKAARQQWRHDMQQAQEAVQDPDSSQLLEDVRQNLEEEAKQLDKMKSAMRTGQVLLKKKEEKLTQLESSLVEEVSDEDTLKGAACKKVVTFDLSDSEDTNSVASSDVPRHTRDLNPPLQLPQPDRIQHLTDSLRRISSELSGVLSILGSLSHQQSPLFASTTVPLSPLPRDGIPLSTYTSLARVQAAGPLVPPASLPLANQWPWSTGLHSGLSSTASQSVDSMLAEKWRKYFPGGFPLFNGSSAPPDSKLGYLPAGEQVRLYQRSQVWSPEADKTSIQGMIDANKRWLENFKKDSKVPLFPSTQKLSVSSPDLVQLGLDEHNQIKVYHY